MSMSISRRIALSAMGGLAVGAMRSARAERRNGPGVTDTQIKIGQTFAYSGPAASFATIAKTDAAFFRSINEAGGLSGRKIEFLSLDDGYSPPKGLELTRKLVEGDGVAFIYGSLGTAVNKVTSRYLNQRKVPQLLIASPSPDFSDFKALPWTMGWQSTTETEAVIFAKYILQTMPKARIGVFYQNDDFGRGMLNALRRGLEASNAEMVVATASYEPTDATVDSQITSLRAAGADTLINAAIPKFAVQAIRQAYDGGWKPAHFLASVSNSVGLTLRPAGLERCQGLLSAQFYKDPTDPQWKGDPALDQWRAWAKAYYPDADMTDANNVYAFARANTMAQILRQCGDDMTRETIMREAANLKDYAAPGLLPGIVLNTSQADYRPVSQMQLLRFEDARWKLIGGVIKD